MDDVGIVLEGRTATKYSVMLFVQISSKASQEEVGIVFSGIRN